MIKINVVVLFIAFSFGCQSMNKDKNDELVNWTSQIGSVLIPKEFSYDIFINEDTNDTIYHGLSLHFE